VWSSLAGSSNRIHVIQVRLGRLEVTPVPISRYDPARNVTDPVDGDQGVGRGRPHPLYVGLIFVGDGVLKFLTPDALGPGRFIKAGIPAGEFLANLDGVFEIGCGLLILVGLLTRLATLPMIVDMLGALGITKVPLLWGHAPLYPDEGGFWDFFHEGRLEVAMLCGSIFLLIVGAGGHSLDARMNRLDARMNRLDAPMNRSETATLVTSAAI